MPLMVGVEPRAALHKGRTRCEERRGGVHSRLCECACYVLRAACSMCESTTLPGSHSSCTTRALDFVTRRRDKIPRDSHLTTVANNSEVFFFFFFFWEGRES